MELSKFWHQLHHLIDIIQTCAFQRVWIAWLLTLVLLSNSCYCLCLYISYWHIHIYIYNYCVVFVFVFVQGPRLILAIGLLCIVAIFLWPLLLHKLVSIKIKILCAHQISQIFCCLHIHSVFKLSHNLALIACRAQNRRGYLSITGQ